MTSWRVLPGAPKPGRLEVGILVLLVLFWIVFGANTLVHSAFLYRPMTDAQVFFRAGWAVWADAPLYAMTDDNGWPYVYPPVFAVLMVPFAHPPHGMDAPWFALPYPVSIVVLYVVESLALIWAVHIAAQAFERAVPFEASLVRTGPLEWQPWWFLRVAPLLAYLPLAAIDIGRGQVTSLVMLSVVAFGVLLARGRSFFAGMALSAGVAIKLFPLIALGLPILRRDFACLAGFAVGLLLFAGLVPLAALGWDGFLSAWSDFASVMTGMATSAGNSFGRDTAVMELDAVGFGAVIYKTWCVLTGAAIDRAAPEWVVPAHLALLVLALAMFTAASWRRSWTLGGPQPGGPAALLLSVALLCAISAMAPPVAQLNYLALGLPLHLAIIAVIWDRRGDLAVPLWLVGLGMFVWPAAFYNTGRDLGRLAWLTTGVYPVLISVAIGFVLLRARTGRSAPPVL